MLLYLGGNDFSDSFLSLGMLFHEKNIVFNR